MALVLSRDMVDAAPLIARELYYSGDSVDWDKVPGVHADYLLKSLAKRSFSGMDWTFNTGVHSEKAGTTVTFSNLDGKKLIIRLRDDLKGVTITLDDGRSIEKPVIEELGKLKIAEMNRFSSGCTLPERTVNRLLYWGDMRLLDYIENPMHTKSDEEELLRNISCTINIGKLVRRFSDSRVIIQKEFRRALLAAEMRQRFTNDLNTEVIEDCQDYTISKCTCTTYELDLKKTATPTATLIEAFQMYLDSPLNSDRMSRRDMVFKFTPKDTDYEVSLFFSGKIKRIKVVHPDGRAPTGEEIIEMSDWANRELAGIVEKVAICKKIEESYEPDPESEITEVCDL
jgi:hypothetical protein